MQQYTVPQFIDVEDRIFGPVSSRQFVICMVGLFLVFIAYRLADFTLFIFAAVGIMVLTGVVAFVKINGQPFHLFVLNLGQTVGRPNLRIWHRDENASPMVSFMTPLSIKAPSVQHKRLTQASLSQLAMLIDTGGAYRPDEEEWES